MNPSAHVMARRLRFEEVRPLIPDIEELEPLVERLIRLSEPDPGSRWAGSGALATLGSRLVDPSHLEAAVPDLIEEVRSRTEEILTATVRALGLCSSHEPEAAVPLLAEAAQRELERGRLRAAYALSASALRVADHLLDRRVALQAYLVVARVRRIEGRLDESRVAYGAALDLARRAEQTLQAATAAIGLGNLEVDHHDWIAARRWYDVAEELLGGATDVPPHRWHLALNRCILAREEGDLDAAEGFLAKARALSHGDPDAVPIVSNARGQLLFARNELRAAESAFREALTHVRAADARITIRVNLAETLVARGHLILAQDEARAAEEDALAHGVTSRLPEVYRMLGEVAAAAGLPDAFLFFEQALEVIDSRALPLAERIRVLEAYANFHARNGDEPAAESLRRVARDHATTLRTPLP